MFELFDSVTVFLSSDVEGYIFALTLVGPATGVLFFKRMHSKYRNFDATHGFEQETSVSGENMVKTDNFSNGIKKTRNAHIKGGNSKNHRARVQEF